jgi:subtilase family serine protease
VTPGGADLIISAATTTATAVAPGGKVTLSNSAKNQGVTSAGSFIVAFHLSTNTTYGDGDDITLTATRTVSSLGAGATSTASTSLVIPSTASPGNYYICVMADRDNTVSETNETNNTRCTAATIQVVNSDLITTAVTPNASTLSATATLSVTNSVKNQSVAAVPVAFKVGFVLSPTASYTDPGAVASTTTRSVSTLAAGAISTATTTVTFPNTTPPGNYYVCVKADSANAVTEADETNNTLCSAGTVTVPQADLIMSVVSMTATAVSPGTNVSLSNTAKNQGLFPAGTFTIAFHLSTNASYGDGDDIIITQTRSVTSLAVGATSTATTTLTVPITAPLGTYYVCAMADSANTITESNETNNSLCTATATLTVALPDLIMTLVSPNSSSVNAGATFTVSNTEKNQGGAPATGFVVNFHLSTDSTYGGGDDIVFTTTRPGGTLAPGASSNVNTTLTIPASTHPGSYYVCAMADYDFRIPETDETNNTLCSASPITIPADLIMTAVSTTAPGAAPGGSLPVLNTVKNQGTSSTNGSSTIGFHLSTNTIYGDGDDIASVTVRSVGTLAANGTSSATTTVVVPSTTPLGIYYVCANADDTNLVAETNETNNSLCTATPIAVGPDLIISAISTTATTVSAGSPFTLSNTVKNQGGSTAGVSAVAFRLSTNTTYGDGDDIVVTATRSLSALTAGATSVASTSIVVPVGTPSGTYYACGMADYLGQVVEIIETNNSLCTATTITVP